MSRNIPEVQLEEYALKLDAQDFECRPEKWKTTKKRTVPIGNRTWTDVEPGKYSSSDNEVSECERYFWARQRQKENHKEKNLLSLHQELFRWTEGIG